MFKKAFSTDGVRMALHYRYAIKDEAHCIAALEEECANEPSLVPSPGNIKSSLDP